MRINPNQGTEALPETGVARAQSKAGVAVNSNSGNALGEDQAQLSGAHTQVQALAAQVLQLPDVRQEKVSALRQAILTGAYRPDKEQVADALLNQLQVQPAA
jgi:negative regulator of flagellin synthesis FlgM